MAFSLATAVSNPAGSAGASPTAYTVTSSLGNLGIVSLVTNTAATVSAVADNLGQSYASVGVVGSDSGGAGNTYIFYKTSSTTGVTTINITHASTGVQLHYYDLSTATGGQLGTGTTPFNNQAGATIAPSMTAQAAGICICPLASGSIATAVAGPFTLDGASGANLTFNGCSAHDLNGAGGTLTATFTAGPSWAAVIATFIEVPSTTVTYMLGHT